MSMIYRLHDVDDPDDKYIVTLPDGKFEEWTVIKQESYSLDRKELIVEKFRDEFPQFKVDDYKQLTNVCSRSKYYTKWLINAGLIYSEQAQLPLYLKNIVPADEFIKIQEDLIKINEKVSEYSDVKRRLAETYKSDLRKIESEEDKATKKVKDKNKLLHILSLNSTSLPFSIQLNIEKYVPNDEINSQESRTMYGRECLIRYKKTLCSFVKDNPEVDIEGLINENMLK